MANGYFEGGSEFDIDLSLDNKEINLYYSVYESDELLFVPVVDGQRYPYVLTVTDVEKLVTVMLYWLTKQKDAGNG